MHLLEKKYNNSLKNALITQKNSINILNNYLKLKQWRWERLKVLKLRFVTSDSSDNLYFFFVIGFYIRIRCECRITKFKSQSKP